MLVPKLRFKREDGTDYPEWENQRIGDCLTYEQPTKYIVKSEQYDDNCKTPVLTANKGFILGYTDEKDGIYNKGDVIIYDDFTMDMKYVRFEFKVKSSAMKMLTATDDNNLYFMYLLLVSLNLHQEVHSRSYISQVEPMVVQIPDLEEQQKIADFLSTVDEVIAQSEAEVQNLEQQKKAAMQKIFSQEVRFKHEDGTDYPAWEEKTLGDITVQINKKTTNKLLPVYSVNNQKGFIPQVEQFGDREIASKDKTNYRKVSFNQFAYNPSRINVGSIAYLQENICVIVSPLYVVFECLPMANPAFIDGFVRTSLFDVQRKMNTAGSVRDSLSYDGFSTIVINLPCLKEQQKIANFLSNIDEAISYAKQELDKWKELKKGLLQQMFV